MKIKICGLKRQEDIKIVNEVLPDFIGFVFAAASSRQLSFRAAEILKSELDGRIISIGVFVNNPIEEIRDLCGRGIIDLIQLHGDEDNGYILRLRQVVNNRIIKAVRVQSAADVLDSLKIRSDYLLYDSYSDKQYGGSGIKIDWSHIRNAIVSSPELFTTRFFLAGGLNEENIIPAIEATTISAGSVRVMPYCVDVSSCAEINGVKDKNKITNLVRIIKNMNQE
jgi:phosphoribosylanthranilate isomerase